MTTSTKWMLDTIIQVRSDVAPGISGWDRDTEAGSLRTLIASAEATVGVPVAQRTQILVWLADRILVTVAPPFRELGLEAWENDIPPGQFNSALISIESSLQDQHDDEQTEEPD